MECLRRGGEASIVGAELVGAGKGEGRNDVVTGSALRAVEGGLAKDGATKTGGGVEYDKRVGEVVVVIDGLEGGSSSGEGGGGVIASGSHFGTQGGGGGGEGRKPGGRESEGGRRRAVERGRGGGGARRGGGAVAEGPVDEDATAARRLPLERGRTAVKPSAVTGAGAGARGTTTSSRLVWPSSSWALKRPRTGQDLARA